MKGLAWPKWSGPLGLKQREVFVSNTISRCICDLGSHSASRRKPDSVHGILLCTQPCVLSEMVSRGLASVRPLVFGHSGLQVTGLILDRYPVS